jgi:serine/threonine-protein kinase RsbW
MRTYTQTEPAAEPIDVTIPARAEYISIARLAAAAVAAHQAFTYDEIEDLKIAVSEACTALIAASSGVRRSPLSLRFVPETDALAIRIDTRGTRLTLDLSSNGEPTPLDERHLGIFLMQCLVDEVDIRHTGDRTSITLRLAKRRQEGSHAGSSPAEQD